jgi:hypothetical protein
MLEPAKTNHQKTFLQYHSSLNAVKLREKFLLPSREKARMRGDKIAFFLFNSPYPALSIRRGR